MHSAARLFVALTLGSLASGCTETATSVASPSTSKCQITATNQPSSYPSTGGRGAVTIAATRDCSWSIAASAAWIAFGGARTGQGEAVVDYTVLENVVPTPRSATLTVDEVQLPLSQAAAPCTYAITPLEASVAAAGGTVMVALSTLTGCSWTAVSNAPWISVESGGSGSANGTIGLAVAANAGGARSATVTIGGRTFTVRQDAAIGGTAPAPPSQPPPTTPPPPTPPPAPAPEAVEFEGLVVALSGSCPNVTLLVNLRTVLADGGTEYRHGRCRDLSFGDRVKVRGTAINGGPVTASRIELKDDDD